MTEKIVLAHCTLADDIERLSPGDNASGRRAEILVKEGDLRITLVTMRAGIELSEHSAPASIAIQVLQGSFEVTYEDESATLNPGQLISLRAEVRHAVRAIEDGAFLLTMGWASK